MIVVPSASAEEVQALPAQSAHGFFEWASARGGEEVTAAECIEKGDPDYWSSLSDEQKNSLANISVELPDFHKFEQNSSGQRAVQIAYANQSPSEAARVAGVDRANSVSHGRYTSAIPSAINYWAGTAWYLNGLPSAFPDISTIGELMKWDLSR